MLGHELRNPLAPILTALELMRAAAAPERSRSERAIIERQVAAPGAPRRRSARRLAHHARQGRARPRAGSSSPRSSRSAIELASPLLEQRAHRLAVDVPPRPVGRRRSDARLAQVFANLLTNAAKYTAARRPHRDRARARAGRVRVRVRDNGHRHRAEMLPRVFDLFVQERAALDRAAGRARPRPDDRAEPGRAARRHGRGATARARAGAASSCVVPAAVPTRVGRAGRGADARRRQRAGARVLDRRRQRGRRRAARRGAAQARATRSQVAHDGPAALRGRRASSRPTSRCSTSACRSMDGYELARRLRALPGARRVRRSSR